MEAILRGAGALRAGDIVHSGVQWFSSHSHNHTHGIRGSSVAAAAAENKYMGILPVQKGQRVLAALLVVASLVATATFQVGLNPPNGNWQDSSDVNNNGTGSSNEPVHSAGQSIMGSYSECTFIVFVVLNSIGFYFSLYTMIVLTSNFPLQLELHICIMPIYSTYSTAVVNISPDNVWIFITVFISVLPFLVGLAAKWARHPVTIWLTKPLGIWIHRFYELIWL